MPTRSCVVCGAKADKNSLVRVVRSPDGRVIVDLTGKQPGRGAYLCRTADCRDRVLKKSRLEHTLRSTLSPEDRQGLGEFLRQGTPLSSDS